MTATLARMSGRGRPPVRTFERGCTAVRKPVTSLEAEAALVRSRTAEAVLRGVLTVPEAAEVWAMLGIIPNGATK